MTLIHMVFMIHGILQWAGAESGGNAKQGGAIQLNLPVVAAAAGFLPLFLQAVFYILFLLLQ